MSTTRGRLRKLRFPSLAISGLTISMVLLSACDSKKAKLPEKKAASDLRCSTYERADYAAGRCVADESARRNEEERRRIAQERADLAGTSCTGTNQRRSSRGSGCIPIDQYCAEQGLAYINNGINSGTCGSSLGNSDQLLAGFAVCPEQRHLPVGQRHLVLSLHSTRTTTTATTTTSVPPSDCVTVEERCRQINAEILPTRDGCRTNSLAANPWNQLPYAQNNQSGGGGGGGGLFGRRAPDATPIGYTPPVVDRGPTPQSDKTPPDRSRTPTTTTPGSGSGGGGGGDGTGAGADTSRYSAGNLVDLPTGNEKIPGGGFSKLKLKDGGELSLSLYLVGKAPAVPSSTSTAPTSTDTSSGVSVTLVVPKGAQEIAAKTEGHGMLEVSFIVTNENAVVVNYSSKCNLEDLVGVMRKNGKEEGIKAATATLKSVSSPAGCGQIVTALLGGFGSVISGPIANQPTKPVDRMAAACKFVGLVEGYWEFAEGSPCRAAPAEVPTSLH